MRKVYRAELGGKHYWLSVRPAWYPAGWEDMEYCARLMMVSNESRFHFRIWGRSKAAIVAEWELGNYHKFCSTDEGGEPKALDALQAVDYAVQRLGKFENYIAHEPEIFYFGNGRQIVCKAKLYWLDVQNISPYFISIEDSSGKRPRDVPLHGKEPIIETLYELERWGSLDEQIAVAPRVPVKDPKSGRYVMQNALTKEVVLFPIKATRVR